MSTYLSRSDFTLQSIKHKDALDSNLFDELQKHCLGVRYKFLAEGGILEIDFSYVLGKQVHLDAFRHISSDCLSISFKFGADGRVCNKIMFLGVEFGHEEVNLGGFFSEAAYRTFVYKFKHKRETLI